MSSDRRESQQETTTVDGNGANSNPVDPTTMKATSTTVSCQRLRLNPNNEHRPDSYEDLQLEFPNSIYSSLEKYLPPNMLVSRREEKVKFMTDIMLRHLPHGERSRVSYLSRIWILSQCLYLFRWDWNWIGSSYTDSTWVFVMICVRFRLHWCKLVCDLESWAFVGSA